MTVSLARHLALNLPFHEPVNQRRGGWSGVSRIHCVNGTYFVKRQLNHTYRELRRGFRGTPTLYREFRNILRLHSAGVRTPQLVRYDMGEGGGLLITRELPGFVDLEHYLLGPSPDRDVILTAVCRMLLRMHLAFYHHGCLYGKHIMVRPGPLPLVAVLDLEKLRRTPRRLHNAAKDIGQLFRHTHGMNESDEEIIRECYALKLNGFNPALDHQMALGKYSVRDED